MRTSVIVLIIGFLISILSSCDKETIKTTSALSEIETTKYFDTEIFAPNDLKIYGKWKLFGISGGLHGNGYDLNFDYLEIKEYGIYGFVRNDSLLEYGKIMPALQNANEIRLKVDLEEDVNSKTFISDKEKYVVFAGDDTLNLNSPCCDRFNYHFERVK
jgi:hypothetical protein